MTKIRVAVVGLVHDHVWHVVDGFRSDARADVVAVAEPHEALREKAKTEWGSAIQTFQCYIDMLDAVKPDVVLVYTDNAMSVHVVEEAAARGIHCLVEKPMAATLEQADRMLFATQKVGVLLMVNWPTAWSPAFAEAVRMAKRGDLGQIFKVRYRAAHQGPQELGCSPYFCEWLFDKRRNGAGALMDYCCYGANYAAYLLGRPNAVTAIAGRFIKESIPVEDNAVVLAKYHHGLGICEASWTQHGFGYELMIHGSRASVRSDGKSLQYSDGTQSKDLALPALSSDSNSAASYFLTCVIEGKQIEGICNPVVSRHAQEILEAGVLAAETGTTVALPVVSRR